ncbi:hypothetical protein [Streptomyces caniscabiei]|nr:hypothetical protein [Streptomyces caniscabiei]MBE4761702.1 hypothetical protein [Streptomyces caniscabiei]MDX2947946.1 hypothetical protein [Streptomyces caniscabiei]MDX2986417.1 hypothetical protein [Streptomyces caniscabiei]
MSGPPDWIAWTLAVSLTAIPIFLTVAVVSALIDRAATKATEPGRTST